jgi:RNA polymerase sigma factor (sigma-70 family)
MWLGRLKAGDRAHVQQLWERYYRRLVGLARQKLGDLPRTAIDEEDVALGAFDSFCRLAEQGRFRCLDDRRDLWEVLAVLTVRKALDVKEHEERDKRDWRRTVSANHAPASESETQEPLLVRLISQDPDPDFAAEMAEWYRHLLGKLPDDQLRTIAQRKLEGYTNKEIAKQLVCSRVTVERQLRRIRKYWKADLLG